MSALLRSLAILAAGAGIAAAVAAAAPAAAVPECTNTGPTTTQCQTPGNAQINTSPGVSPNDYPFGWPWWGLGSGISISLG